MKTGIISFFVCLICLTGSVLYAIDDAYIEMNRLDADIALSKKDTLVMYVNQIVEIELEALFISDDTDSSFGKFFQRNLLPWPEFAEGLHFVPPGWKTYFPMAPGQDTTITQTLLLNRPQTPGEYIIEIAAVMKKDVEGVNSAFYMITLNIVVEEPPLGPPEIYDEPEFTSGLSNIVYWQNLDNAYTQDVYCYDILDSTQLIYAKRRIYKSDFTDSLEAVFQGLEDEHTYAYFTKSTHLWNNDTISLHSKSVYSTQDNSPPSEIDQPVVLLQNNGEVKVAWFKVEDTVSGVSGYKIYRTENFERETCLDTVFVDDQDIDSYEWMDTNVDSGSIYVYRVSGFDLVGNENQGDYSQSVIPAKTISGDNEIDMPGVDYVYPEPVEGQTFIQSCIDSIDYQVYFQENQAQRIRIISVRDDTNYFHQKPVAGGRYFDSGWLVPSSPPVYMFDYHYTGEYTITNNTIEYLDDGPFLDKNFVNGHEYFRRLIVDFGPTQINVDIGSVIPDCFAPDDVQNLYIQTTIDDPDTENPAKGYTSWHVELSWTPAFDGVSKVKRYHIYRKIESLDDTFGKLTIPVDDYLKTSFIDRSFPSTGIQNPVIQYRVVSEDNAGNLRSWDTTTRQVQTQGLNPPITQFHHTNNHQYLTWSPDTLLTNQDSVEFELLNFDTENVSYYFLLIDSVEHSFSFQNQSLLKFAIPNQEYTNLKLRAVYKSGESTIWCQPRIVVRTRDTAPENLENIININDWSGDIKLNWNRPSFDAKYYEIWRWTSLNDSVLVDTLTSELSKVSWQDFYAYDELQKKAGDTLVAHQLYEYGVRKINYFGDASQFSQKISQYCTKPPEIFQHAIPKIENGNYLLTIDWKRPVPNFYSNSFLTQVEVSEDSLVNIVHIDTVSENTSYTYHHAQNNHNYIFRLREIPNNNTVSISNWSKPKTVSSLVRLQPFYVIPQPKGKMYLNWEEDQNKLFQKYKIEEFILFRDADSLRMPFEIQSYMDSDITLKHGNVHTYAIYGLDSLGQPVLANTITDTVDTGSVYIPEVLDFTKIYFNADSIQVFWEWKGQSGNSVQSMRNAVQCLLDVSVNPNFPEDTLQTVRTGPFSLNDYSNSIFSSVPEMLGRINSQLYFRIQGIDIFGNPDEDLWSTDFFPIKSVYLDTISPYPVSDLKVSNIEAFNLTADTVISTLSWTGKDVEYLATQSNLYWDQLTRNIHRYVLYRKTDLEDKIIGEWLATGDSLYTYTLADTILNRYQEWYLLVEDSAENTIITTDISQDILLYTPMPPNPIDYRICEWDAAGPDSLQYEYYVQMAMSPDHFELAYLIGSENTKSRMLCESEWISSQSFECPSGWGDGVIDTTWFRIQTRRFWNDQYWESAWSDITYFADGQYPLDEPHVALKEAPEEFKVYPVYPNPFNSQATIRYDLASPGEVSIRIFNVLGREVYHYNQIEEAGHFINIWHGTDLYGHLVSSGVYIAVVSQRTDKGIQHIKQMRLLLIK